MHFGLLVGEFVQVICNCVLHIDIDNYREAITGNQDCCAFCKSRSLFMGSGGIIIIKKIKNSLSILVHDGTSYMCVITVPCLI